MRFTLLTDKYTSGDLKVRAERFDPERLQLTHPRVETSFDTEPKLFLAPDVGLDYTARSAGYCDLGRRECLLFRMYDSGVILFY